MPSSIEQPSSNLFLCPLVTLLNSDNKEESKAASDALSKIIRNSSNIRESQIKNGFVEMARINLTDENTPDHVHTNILIAILDLVFNSADIRTFSSLFGIISQISEDEDMKKKSIGLMAKKICAILSSQGITGPSSSDEIQELKMQSEEQKRQIEMKTREIEELKRNDEEKTIKISDLERNQQEKSRENEELKRKNEQLNIQITELLRKGEQQTRNITQLEIQLAESKSEPNTNIQQVSEFQSGEIPIQITVPSGSYTKKEGEFIYTSTKDEYKTFPINPSVQKGICRCEFKANKAIGSCYNKNSMFFHNNGNLYQNGKSTSGNKMIKDNDSVAVEANLDQTPRIVHLFINNFFLNIVGDLSSVLSLKRQAATSVQNIPVAKGIAWE
ncbi:MAG: hypothetical protein EZS28_018645 [Streblomastix strix]|uniref:Uncharacterized protein n=1 Tax=Streblomastix strix TaxID=222440 RepID=A0A5J4VTU0_9EUKA|nr:MAG: hypothetical protein EZS28_018645 [Streblomastix strix]